MASSSSHPCKVAIISRSLAAYRVEYYDYTAAALGADSEVTLFYANETASDHAWSGLLDGVKFLKHRHFRSASGTRIAFLQKLRDLWKELRDFNATCIIVCEYNLFSLVGIVAGILRGVPVLVHTEVGRHTSSRELPCGTKIRHWIFGCFVKGQLAASPAARHPCNPSIKNILFVPHAVTVPGAIHYKEFSSECFTFLFVGNLIPRKGIDLLCNAVVRLREKASAFSVRLVGGGDHDWAKRIIDDSGIGDFVNIIGFKEGDSLYLEYQQAHAFILLSRFDTYGAVGHEAAAHGLPLIISRHAGCSEVMVQPGQNGFVVNPEDSEAVAGAMVTLMEDRILARQMSMSSLQIAHLFSVDKSAHKTAELIKRLS